MFADAVVESAWHEGVEDAAHFGVAPETMQGSGGDVDLDAGRRGDLPLTEQEHQVALQDEEGFFLARRPHIGGPRTRTQPGASGIRTGSLAYSCGAYSDR